MTVHVEGCELSTRSHMLWKISEHAVGDPYMKAERTGT
jgi:hypothetical protein